MNRKPVTKTTVSQEKEFAEKPVKSNKVWSEGEIQKAVNDELKRASINPSDTSPNTDAKRKEIETIIRKRALDKEQTLSNDKPQDLPRY